MKNSFYIIVLIIITITICLSQHLIKNEIYAKEILKNISEPNENKEIEYTNYVYNDRIFGNSFKGLAMSIAPEKEQYQLGEEIQILALIKNYNKESIYLYRLNDSAMDFRYALFFSDGNSVPKSEFSEKFEASLDKLPGRISERDIYIRPKDIGPNMIHISQFFKIEKEGTYFLVLMRRITDSWDDGFMISNMIKINIVKKKEQSRETN